MVQKSQFITLNFFQIFTIFFGSFWRFLSHVSNFWHKYHLICCHWFRSFGLRPNLMKSMKVEAILSEHCFWAILSQISLAILLLSDFGLTNKDYNSLWVVPSNQKTSLRPFIYFFYSSDRLGRKSVVETWELRLFLYFSVFISCDHGVHSYWFK